jgi:phytoene synthase
LPIASFHGRVNLRADAPEARSVREVNTIQATARGGPLAIMRSPTSWIAGTSYAECNRIARESRSSFYLAFLRPAQEKRNALCALYAFMRLVDDVSDEPGDLESKRRPGPLARDAGRSRLGRNTAGHPILPALADTIARFEIPTRYFHDLILGAEMDLTIDSYATFDRLSEYCYRVAGTVGLTCLHVFGFRDPKAPDLAERLGLAFQLTNIIRDVRSDFEMGRVYLPQEDLDRFGAAPKTALGGLLTQSFESLLEFEADRAWRILRRGRAAGAPVSIRTVAQPCGP